MPVAVFGTAHLFGLAADDVSSRVLDAAWASGFRAFDTAPLYGHGRSEPELGTRVSRWDAPVRLTSKVGLEPTPPDRPALRVAKAAAGRLPGAVRRRLRPGGGAPVQGVFEAEAVRASLERTLRRLGHVDRLLLHEARADSVGDDVLEVLASAVAAGDIARAGVATVNHETAAVIRLAPDLLTVAHVEVGPFASDPGLPPGVTAVGHGVLGPGGAALRRLEAVRTAPGQAAGAWEEATRDTRWSGRSGLAAAVVARASTLRLSDVIVATSRVERLAGLRSLAAGDDPMPEGVARALSDLVVAARAPASVD